MKARTWFMLASAGAGAYLYYSGTGRKLVQRANTKLEERRQARATQELSTMLDDVVHKDDIPDTPVKQAFEAAVHDKAHH